MSSSNTPVRMSNLMSLLEGLASVPSTAATVFDMTLSSREVRPGGLFFALQGTKTHGLEFAAQALSNGAQSILWEPAPGLAAPCVPSTVYAAPVPNLSQLVGRIADRFFDHPSAQLDITAITGTNGKTTCACLLAESLAFTLGDAAYIGTLGVGRLDSLQVSTHTTPDAVSIHRQLAALRAAGTVRVSMEVSSHAIVQHRIAGVRIRCAAFTNLTRDHLDYHGSMHRYAQAKALLFERAELTCAVINIGDAFGRELARRTSTRVPVIAVSIGTQADDAQTERVLRAVRVDSDPRGLTLTLAGSFGTGTIRMPLIGRFNAENVLVVLGLLLAHEVPIDTAIQALARCHAPPGRMQAIDGGANQPLAVVDYAHTPDALAKALNAAREHCHGLVWCVFGCGGDRDSGKRAMMGAVADDLADRIIVTDDNPRSEQPAAITREITAAIKRLRARVIHDRSEAIRTALSEANAADVVLIAGKGHEDYQIYGDARLAFSDKREVERHFGIAA